MACWLLLVYCCCCCLSPLALAQSYRPFRFDMVPRERCLTVDGSRGDCVRIQQCPAIVQLINQQGFTRDVTAYLRKLQCGFDRNEALLCCVGASGDVREQMSTTIAAPLSVSQPEPTRPQSKPNSPNLLPVDCGIQPVKLIYGGEKTRLQEHPWIVLLGYRDIRTPQRTVFLCGGVLINKRYVLTAAHCIYGDPAKYKLDAVRLGEHNTATNPDCEVDDLKDTVCSPSPLNVKIEKQVMHPEYDIKNRDQYNDIGLLRLSTDIKFGDSIQPICLPLSELAEDRLVGSDTTVAGFGRTETNRTGSPVMLKVVVRVKNVSQCATVYKAKGLTVRDLQLCVGGERGKDSCRGDSGGPLMAPLSLPLWSGQMRQVAVGLVSYGPLPCGMAGWPGVYTRVGAYMPWVLSQLQP